MKKIILATLLTVIFSVGTNAAEMEQPSDESITTSESIITTDTEDFVEEMIDLASIVGHIISDIKKEKNIIYDCLEDLQDHKFSFCGTPNTLIRPLERIASQFIRYNVSVSNRDEIIEEVTTITNQDRDKAKFFAQFIKNYIGRQ